MATFRGDFHVKHFLAKHSFGWILSVRDKIVFRVYTIFRVVHSIHVKNYANYAFYSTRYKQDFDSYIEQNSSIQTMKSNIF